MPPTDTDFASPPGAPFPSGLVVRGKSRNKHKQPTHTPFRTTGVLLQCATKGREKALITLTHAKIVLYTYLEFHLYQDP